MSTEELSRIEKQICRLAIRLEEAYEQINRNSRRIDSLTDKNILLRQRLEKVERVNAEVVDHPALSMPALNLSYITTWSPTTEYSTTMPVIDSPQTFVYDHKGVCVSESRKVPGATPFGKES